jgi:hypothetical protein
VPIASFSPAAATIYVMTTTQTFEFATIVCYSLPVALTILVLLFRWPPNPVVRCALAVSLGWLAWVLLTIFLHNPAGIRAGYEQGLHFPEGRYDNNTSSIALFFGWTIPGAAAAAYFILLAVWRRVRRHGT